MPTVAAVLAVAVAVAVVDKPVLCVTMDPETVVPAAVVAVKEAIH